MKEVVFKSWKSQIDVLFLFLSFDMSILQNLHKVFCVSLYFGRGVNGNVTCSPQHVFQSVWSFNKVDFKEFKGNEARKIFACGKTAAAITNCIEASMKQDLINRMKV